MKHPKLTLQEAPQKNYIVNLLKQLQHFILCNMMCSGALKSNIVSGLLPWSIFPFSAP